MEEAVELVFTENVVEEALYHFSLEKETKKLGDFENYVFEVKRGNSIYILRITHSSHRSMGDLFAEINWMNYLFTNKLNVPRAYESIEGKFVVPIRALDGSYFYACLFSRVPGEAIRVKDKRFNEELFFKWGQTIGNMHKVTKNYQINGLKQKRPQWDEDDLLALERYIPKEEKEVIEKSKNLLQELSKLDKNKNNFGLIHTDIHSGNFFFDGNEIHVFDFDDCCYHWFSSDIAIPLYYSAMYRYARDDKGARNTFAKLFLKSFLEGYATENSVPEEWQAHIPLFLKLRDITLYSVLHKKFPSASRDESLLEEIRDIKARIENEEPIVDISNIEY